MTPLENKLLKVIIRLLVCCNVIKQGDSLSAQVIIQKANEFTDFRLEE